MLPPRPITWRLTTAPATAEPPEVTVTVIVEVPPDGTVTADELTATASARVSALTVIQADVVAPAYPSFDAWTVTWTSVAPCTLGAVIAALRVPARSVVPLATWFPPIQTETAAPPTGAPSESVTFAIAVVDC